MNHLKDNIELLKDSDFESIELYSYTDNTGSIKRNLTRSHERAEVVKEKLMGLGISEDKIKIFAKGETNFIADNSTKQGRLQNRRIEFKVI